MTTTDSLSEMHGADTEETALMDVPKNFLTYIRPVLIGEERGYAVCSEDGVHLAIFGSHDAAYFSARQFNLSPQNVH
jgi:hypothetical protein